MGAVPPSLKFGGTDFVTGYFGAWAPIGAEKTASGYEVAWKDASAITTPPGIPTTTATTSPIGNMGWVSGPARRWNRSRPASTRISMATDISVLVTTAIETQGSTEPDSGCRTLFPLMTALALARR